MKHQPSLPLDDEAYAGLQKSAREHLWMHFTRMSSYDHGDVPIIVKGEGAYIWDAKGRKYLDALAGLFVSQVGHGRTELAEAAAKQAKELAFFPLWSYAHPNAIELAERVAELRPRRPQPGLLHQRRRRGRRDRLEAGEELLQAHRQADEAQGDQPRDRLPRHHPGRAVDHRAAGAQGAVRAAGALDVPGARTRTSTARPSASRAARTRTSRTSAAGPPTRSPSPSRTRAPRRSPRSSSSPCRTPAAASRPRPATSSGSARSATSTTCCWSATRSSAPSGGSATCSRAERYGYQPDMITCAKGITSGYAPLGAMIATDRLMEPFLDGHGVASRTATPSAATRCPRRWRWRTSTSSSARASTEHVLDNQDAFRVDAGEAQRPADRRRRPR